MPFDAWKKRLDCNRDDLAELLTIDMDEPIEVPTMPRRTNAYQSRDERFYEVNGRSMTLTQWSKYAHISKKLLAKRIDDGMTMEEAITTPTETRSLRPHKPREVMYYTYRGETRTLYQWSEILGVSEGKLRKRIEAKLPPKKVMLPAPRHRVIYVKGNEPTLPRKKGYIVAEEEERKRKEREERDRKRLEALNGDQQS